MNACESVLICSQDFPYLLEGSLVPVSINNVSKIPEP